MHTSTLKIINNDLNQQISEYTDQLEQWVVGHIKIFNYGYYLTIDTIYTAGTHNIDQELLTNFAEETRENLTYCTTKKKCMSKFTTKKTNTKPGKNDTALSRNYASQEEIGQAIKLATNTLREYGTLLEKNQASVLQNFLRHKVKNGKPKITQKKCMKIIDITKQAQNKLMKLNRQKQTLPVTAPRKAKNKLPFRASKS